VEAVWLDELSGAAVGDLVSAGDQAWSRAYADWSADPSRADHRRRWFDTIDSTIRELWRLAMGPVLARLGQRGATAAILVPTGLLTMLPLHAAATADTTAPTGTRYAVDDLVLSYAPSAFAMAHARRSAGAAPTDRLLVVDEPAPVSAAPLPASAVEAAAVASMFEAPVVLSRQAATRAAVLGRLPGVGVLHMACHGRTNWIDPLRSGLLLADDEWLAVGDLLDRRLSAARLACLSACETGGIGLWLPDEVVSLPAALIQAGFAGVIASMWAVSDVGTAMLMQRFHVLWRDRGDPAAALREAQRWLRDTTNEQKAEYFRGQMQGPDQVSAVGSLAAQLFTAMVLRRGGDRDFAHPFWWAAFCLTGA
jgi:CHAT domain-containing protein